MKVDTFIKVNLLLITIFVGVMALQLTFQPNELFGKAISQGQLLKVQPVSLLLDTSSGEIWEYDFGSPGKRPRKQPTWSTKPAGSLW